MLPRGLNKEVMLYIVGTPIGNLGDMTHRAVEVLGKVDLILCEDTRHSKGLLDRYGISKPLKSYHQFNEASRFEEVASELREGREIALISDAGMPGISDPGQLLVQRCREEGLEVTVVPGPSAVVTALALSGFPSDRFQFGGFLPRKEGELKKILVDALHYPGTSLFYESPQRLKATLKMLVSLKRGRVGVGRELTKLHEEFFSGTAQEVLAHWNKGVQKGEIVVLIEGGEEEDWKILSPIEHVEMLIEAYALSKNEAIKMAATLRGVPKREIYNEVLSNQ